MENHPDQNQVIILRDQKSSEATVRHLAQIGFRPTTIPLVSYHLISSPEQLQKAILECKPDTILLSSQRACEYFCDIYQKRELGSDFKFIVVGQKSAQFLAKRGFEISHQLKRLLDLLTIKTPQRCQILYPCSRERNQAEVEEIRQMGWNIREEELYAVDFAEIQPKLAELLRQFPNLSILVYSSSQARALANYSSRNATIFCMGQRTYQSLKDLGFENIYISREPEESSLLDLLVEIKQKDGNIGGRP